MFLEIIPGVNNCVIDIWNFKMGIMASCFLVRMKLYLWKL